MPALADVQQVRFPNSQLIKTRYFVLDSRPRRAGSDPNRCRWRHAGDRAFKTAAAIFDSASGNLPGRRDPITLHSDAFNSDNASPHAVSVGTQVGQVCSETACKPPDDTSRGSGACQSTSGKRADLGDFASAISLHGQTLSLDVANTEWMPWQMQDVEQSPLQRCTVQ
jgi:hypothetical protein